MTFGDNGKGQIIGCGKIQITPSVFIENILYVKGLKHNLINISQLCNKGYKVSFESSLCMITNLIDNCIIFTGHRLDNIYMIDFNNISNVDHCLIATNPKMNEISWLWHRRLGHASTHQITKLIKRDLVKEILKLNFEENKICDARQLKK